ncbi:MAG TPA: ATP-binding protein [Streptomyces sp.]|uniref:ATP-binding protein n=1 Tax=Streptomyces sp. TaxID=1931 RepID=UPI002D63020D|nr:ATP-binding protein [Streptomyces sp.]HZG05528.1 ATP-binding protein [Streptomyces sp.]
MEAGPTAYDVELRLPESGDSIARARDLTRELLDERAYRGRHDDVVLVVSELVSNALRHGRGAPVLRLAGEAERVRVEVSDDSPVLPAPRQSGPDGGWGLTVIERLAVAWGVSGRDTGKTVWCEMAPERTDRDRRDGPRFTPGLAV